MSTKNGPDVVSLQERVRRRIEADIKSGKLGPGTPIDEKRLAQQFRASRTPVREALLVLATQGLVEIRPRSGIFVRRPTPAEQIALFEALAELEAIIARLAAQRLRKSERALLKKALDAGGRVAKTNDPDRYEAANAVFHEVLYRASANPIIVEQIRAIRMRLAAFRLLGFDRPGRPLASHTEHQQLTQAVLAGDTEAAARIMRSHISAGGTGFADLVLSNDAG
jgi:DNA-binding GntR family transcriptional regulator